MSKSEQDTQFKEYLEEIRDLKKVCSISFRDVEGMLTVVRGRIVKMEEVSGREIIETDAGFVIGMDQIVAVNDRQQGHYC
jgi:hypothetical protein